MECNSFYFRTNKIRPNTTKKLKTMRNEKKAKKKSGTSSLNTTAGVNTTTSSGSVNIA